MADIVVTFWPTTGWPTRYHVQDRWDPNTMLHTQYAIDGTVLQQDSYVQADLDAWLLAKDAETEAGLANERTVEGALADDLAAMQAIIDDTNANINQNPAQRIKDQARALRRLIRHALKDFGGAT